jgi:hypothetical protein
MEIIEKYFKDELYQGMYEEMRRFLTSYEIKEGKFEGNEILLNKLNRESVVIYKLYELQDGSYDYCEESSILNIDKLVELLDCAMEEKSNKLKRGLEQDKYRIIKIGKEALYEFVYESFVDNQEEYLNVDSIEVIDSFDIDFANGNFIFMVHKSEDENENVIPLPKEIDLKKLLKDMQDTTHTMFGDNRYIELSLDEIISIQENNKIENKK